jgi:hypothetical protein
MTAERRPPTDSVTALESLPEDQLCRLFAAWLRSDASGLDGFRTSAAPWERLLWAHEQTRSDAFRDRLERCAARLLDDLLVRAPDRIDAGEVYHLGLVLGRFGMRSLASRLRRLVERPWTRPLLYEGIRVRQQLLYHLQALGYHLDHEFWLREFSENPGPAYLAISRFGAETALAYLPALLAVETVPLGQLLTEVLERPGTEGLAERMLAQHPDSSRLREALGGRLPSAAGDLLPWRRLTQALRRPVSRLASRLRPDPAPQLPFRPSAMVPGLAVAMAPATAHHHGTRRRKK